MAKKLKLALLERIEIRINGVLLTDFKSQKSLAQLCYLAVTGQPHARSSLAGLFWRDMP